MDPATGEKLESCEWHPLPMSLDRLSTPFFMFSGPSCVKNQEQKAKIPTAEIPS